ncbi:MAG: lipopolysaccharide kinase InaA family protein [Pseudomonadota bacterium]
MQSTHSPQFQPLLQQHQLASFEQLWNYQGDWFEPPNRERGGWSGVNYIELTDNAGNKHGFYLKRQQAHMRRTWRHPMAGEPTFVREFEILKHLSKHDVATPKWVFFGSQQDKAILLTQALTGFVAADEWLNKHADISVSLQNSLMRALADAVRKMHQAGVQHRSLYLKHLFVKQNNSGFEVAAIDFEKSRITAFIRWFRLADLITLHYRTADLSAGNKLAFFKQYFAIQHLTPFYKALCRYLHQQSLQKRR